MIPLVSSRRVPRIAGIAIIVATRVNGKGAGYTREQFAIGDVGLAVIKDPDKVAKQRARRKAARQKRRERDRKILENPTGPEAQEAAKRARNIARRKALKKKMFQKLRREVNELKVKALAAESRMKDKAMKSAAATFDQSVSVYLANAGDSRAYRGRDDATRRDMRKFQRVQRAFVGILKLFPDPKVPIAFGKGYFGQRSRRGNRRGTPVMKCIRRMLAAVRRVVLVDEHRTSKMCSFGCGTEVEFLPKRRVRCPREDCQGNVEGGFGDRDVDHATVNIERRFRGGKNYVGCEDLKRKERNVDVQDENVGRA